jgi:RNA polymerase sigma-70 factor, ECF subfamily
MSRAAAGQPGSHDPGLGLRALAVLINEALAEWGTRHRLIGPTPAVAGGAPLAGWTAAMSVEVTSVPPRSGRARHGAADAADGAVGDRVDVAGEPALGVGASPEHDPEPPMLDQQHVETWHLVRQAQDGDGEAFGQLYDRYVDTVYRFIYYRVNDRALAEDFTSETFLRALRRISTISYQGRDIGAWFVTIARNIVLDHLKSARHRLEVSTPDTVESTDRAPSPEAAVIDSMASQRLMAAVGQLGDEQRECVMLRFIQGFSVSETAAVMGKNDGAVKALQHRAVRKLADLIGGDLR